MNTIRSVMTVFLGVVIAASVLGWHWAAVLPAAKADGARAVLTVCALGSFAAVAIIWTAKPRKAL